MKKKILFSTILVGILLTTVPVEAQGTANVSLVSEDKVQVGDTFKVSLRISDINNTYDGVVSMSSRLVFDKEKLEFISGKAMEEPYSFALNTNTMMIAGLDVTLKNGFYSTTEVYEFTFKALKEGNSTITLQKATLTDSKGYIATTVIDKNIEVCEKVEGDNVVVTESPIVAKQEVILDTRVENSKEITEVETKEENKVESKQEGQTKIEVSKKDATSSGKVKRARRTFRSEKIQKTLKDFVLKLKNLF